jgi:exodeoxyribonuclease V alpha subunit
LAAERTIRLPDHLFALLDDWIERDWLRPLDRAFVVFLKEQHPEESHDLVLLAAALASHQLGRGHVCLDLRITLAQPEETLSLPPEGDTGQPSAVAPANLLEGTSLDEWVQCLADSPLVETGDGGAPLVLTDGRLYLRRYWKYTQQTAQQILEKLQQPISPPSQLPKRLDELFASLRTPSEQAKTEIHWQSVAAAIAAASAFTVISGGPGTGKTTTVVHLIGLLQAAAMERKRKLRIRLAAPTGKAAARLTESISYAIDQLPEALRDALPGEVTTLHRLLGSRPETRHFVHNARNPLHVDLLVVDEASMIDLEMMAALLSALPDHARLILLGDKDQLASVEAGSVLGDLCRNVDKSCYLPETTAWIEKNTGYRLPSAEAGGTHLDQHIVVLQKSHRFDRKSGIGALARAVNTGDPKRVAKVWQHGFRDISQVVCPSPDDALFAHLVLNGRRDNAARKYTCDDPMGYRAYLERIQSGPRTGMPLDTWMRAVLKDFNRVQLLSPLRRGQWGVERLNKKAALVLFRENLISDTSGWYPGRPVMVTRNDYNLGLMNGDTGIVLPVSDDGASERIRLNVVFPMADGRLKKVLPSRLNNVETAYAMTVHKSQGSEFDHTVLAFPEAMCPVLTRELIYTAITRSRTRFTLLIPHTDLLSEAVKGRVHRASGLGELLTS